MIVCKYLRKPQVCAYEDIWPGFLIHSPVPPAFIGFLDVLLQLYIVQDGKISNLCLFPDPLMLDAQPGLANIKDPKKPPSGAAAVVGGPLAPLTLPSKAESVVSITSQCSYSSTIVHVGDKKPQPESGESRFEVEQCKKVFFLFCFLILSPPPLIYLTEIIEDVAESPAPPALPVSVVSPPSQEKEAYKRLGLTKQVLAAHTQKEEQAFLTRCRELMNARTPHRDCPTSLHKQRGLTIAEGMILRLTI